jgi:hypothetical protein
MFGNQFSIDIENALTILIMYTSGRDGSSGLVFTWTSKQDSDEDEEVDTNIIVIPLA